MGIIWTTLKGSSKSVEQPNACNGPLLIQARTAKVEDLLASLQERLDSSSPVSAELATLPCRTAALEDIECVLLETDDAIKDLQIFYRSEPFEELFQNTPDQLDSFLKRFDFLEKSLNRQKNYLLELTSLVGKFETNLEEVKLSLKDAASQEETFHSTSAKINEHRETEFFRFRTKCVKPLMKQISDVNRSGKDLLSFACTEVDVHVIKDKLDKLNVEWNTLKNKINDIQGRLSNVPRLRENLKRNSSNIHQSLQKEEKYQGVQSTYSNLVQAQEKEIELFRDLKIHVLQLIEFGTEALMTLEDCSLANPGCHLEEILRDIIQCGHTSLALLNSSDFQNLDLPAAQDFWNSDFPVQDWMKLSFNKIEALITVPTQHEEICTRISEQMAYCIHFKSLKKKLDELVESTKLGEEHDNEELRATAAHKLENIAYQFDLSINTSEELKHLLELIYTDLKNFTSRLEVINASVRDGKVRLKLIPPVCNDIGMLTDKSEKLTELISEVENYSSVLEQIESEGHEIMEHAKVIDSEKVKKELERAQILLDELLEDALKQKVHTEDALLISEDFLHSRDLLVAWLEEFETHLGKTHITATETKLELLNRIASDIPVGQNLLDDVNRFTSNLESEFGIIYKDPVSRLERRFQSVCKCVFEKEGKDKEEDNETHCQEPSEDIKDGMSVSGDKGDQDFDQNLWNEEKAESLKANFPCKVDRGVSVEGSPRINGPVTGLDKSTHVKNTSKYHFQLGCINLHLCWPLKTVFWRFPETGDLVVALIAILLVFMSLLYFLF